MPTLRSPDGRVHSTSDPIEVRNLVLGHGYTVVDSGEPTPPVADDGGTEDQETSEETTPDDG